MFIFKKYVNALGKKLNVGNHQHLEITDAAVAKGDF